jgi:TonB family protein
MGRGEGAQLLAYLGLAAVLHLAAAAGVIEVLQRRSGAIRHNRAPPYVALRAPQLSFEQTSTVRQARRQRLAAAAKATPKVVKEKPLSGQVVDVAPSADRRPPPQSAFLSEVNSRVDKETRSRQQGGRYSVRQATPMPQREVAAASAALEPQPSVAASAGRAKRTAQLASPEQKPTPAAAGTAPSAAAAARDQVALRVSPLGGALHNSEARRPAAGSAGPAAAPGAAAALQAPASLSLAQLIPAVGSTALMGGGPSNDALRQVPFGDATLLNTREFKYASYFNRLKREVSEHWRPLQTFDQRDPTGNIYGYVPRTTTVCVTLTPDGSVHSVDVKRSSGVSFLDDEAVAAFQRAKGFPNPPRGLVDPGGHISFLFGFQVDMTGR